MAQQETAYVLKGGNAEIAAFGANGTAAQTAATAHAAVAATAATNSSPYGFSQAQANDIITLLNQTRAALVANGIMV